ncbi:unnamed protein product [Microthlaspi erraticum]|uniref:Uncharacterized protein n=1 Tax=Microthlaspi erraticum TaxID=1685480 RepID=A0A6D2KFD5_9BRAS|nr:unnamed protein product [Microthlaspi erraticum]
MDGLIPMAFRAVKKNLTRRRYECLSSSATTRESYDFVSDNIATNVDGHHRRAWSLGDFSSLSTRETKRNGPEKGCSPPREGQLVNFILGRLTAICVEGQDGGVSREHICAGLQVNTTLTSRRSNSLEEHSFLGVELKLDLVKVCLYVSAFI